MRPFILALLVLAFANAPANAPANAQNQATDEMLQCMADCVVQEGEDKTETCKQRCAGIDVRIQGAGQRDCMATYKACKKDCAGDKDCKKACKTALLNCV